MEKSNGIFAMLEPLDRERIRRLLPISFEDIYESIETTREEVRDLEIYLYRLFIGDVIKRTAEGPDNLPC